ncbi:restriction endonuclease subunit S [Amycolatopsis sp. NPDC003676]
MIHVKESGLGWTPSIPAHWRVVPLRYFAKVGTGHTPDRNNSDYWTNCDIPWVTTPDVTKRPEALTPLLDTEQKISALGMAHSAAELHPANTVMLSRTASVGYSVLIGKPMATTQAFVTWSPGSSLDSRYLLLVLRAMHQEWDRLAYGSTHRTIYMPDLESLRIPLPPLEEQRRIADFLDAETGRMREVEGVLRRTHVVLNERASAILDSTVAGRLVSGSRVCHPMYGDFPESWDFAPLRKLVPRVGVGVVVDPSSYFSEEGVPFLHGSNVREFSIDLDGVKRISESNSRRLWRSRLETGDVVVVRAGYPGRAAVVPGQLDGANCASILIVKKGNRLLPGFLAAVLNSPLGKAQVDQVRYGAAQEQINVGHIVEFLIPTPSMDEQQKLVKWMDLKISEVDKIRQVINRQIDLLAERRQALITAAVTGQLDVTTARCGVRA